MFEFELPFELLDTVRCQFDCIQRNYIQNVNIPLYPKYCLFTFWIQSDVNILDTCALDTVELAPDCIQAQTQTQTED